MNSLCRDLGDRFMRYLRSTVLFYGLLGSCKYVDRRPRRCSLSVRGSTARIVGYHSILDRFALGNDQ